MNLLTTSRQPDGLDLITGSGLLKIQIINERIYHIRYTQLDKLMESESLMVTGQAQPLTAWKVNENAEWIELTTRFLHLEIERKTCAFTWKDHSGGILVCEPRRGGKHLQVNDLNGRQVFSTRLDFVFSEGEAIYGFGQHEEGILNYRGRSQALYQHNLKVAMPVMLSTRGYAILFNSYSLSTFHDDQYGSFFWSEAEDALDFYFLYGPEWDELVAGIRALTGPTSMLPRWAYGYIQSKDRYKRQSELIEIAEEYRRREIGLDCIALEWRSSNQDRLAQKQIDPDRFPNPDRLVNELNRSNVRLMVSLWPRLDDTSEPGETKQPGLQLGDEVTYNPFRPEARALYWRQVNQNLFQHGFASWWSHASEPFDPDWHGAVKPEPWQRMLLHANTYKKYLDLRFINAYSLLHSKGIYEGQRSATDEKRVLHLTRSGSPGEAHYGSVTWSGHTSASWDALKKQIAAGLNFTCTGNPRWTSGIGGYYTDRKPVAWFRDGEYPEGCESPAYRELYARWFQFGAFLPLFLAHGADTPREVWRFGKPGDLVYETLVRYIRLRYRLLPYIYSLAAWETFKGYTMLRSLAFDFRHDPYIYNIVDQFMFGPALMICPIVEPMAYDLEAKPVENSKEERTVYLPSGCGWYNFWNGKRYAGGQQLHIPAPLEILPIFVREGSILPMGPHIQHSGERPGAALELRVYPGQDAHFDLYCDEGDSYRYEQGEYAWTALDWQEAGRRLRVGPRRGNYQGMPPRQVFRIAVAPAGIEASEPAGELAISGTEVAAWEWV